MIGINYKDNFNSQLFNKNNNEALELLKSFNMPFKDNQVN